jgi:phenylalanyl-tRNA synthetase beta chain
MLLSFNWLKKYVNLADSTAPEEVAEKLKLATVEVENIVSEGKDLENIVVGKITKVEPHPQADRLKVCAVDVGEETLSIVCGGSNVAEGMLVAVAKIGARVRWHGEGEMITLEPATIRGVASAGMICGADEIGLADMFPKKDEKEITDLSGLNLKPGTLLAEALGLTDTIFEIDNKSLSHRPDLWGHYGIAREVAVLFNRSVLPYKTSSLKAGKSITLNVTVENPALCPRYSAVVLTGIKVGESPAWLKKALTSVGIRPINNVVDATNFVMVDLGQPLHAFDAEHLGEGSTKSITVRPAETDESITLLDNKKYTLNPNSLVIAHENEILALAGVMGGAKSGVNETTTSVVLESANFEATSIRTTSTALTLRTDASMRFEKALDPTLCGTALEKIVELIKQLCPTAEIASEVIDIFTSKPTERILTIPTTFFEAKIGKQIPTATIVKILERLGFEVEEKKGSLIVVVPTWRATKDILIAEDVVEEILRIEGYDSIPSTLPTFPINPPLSNHLIELEYALKERLAATLGYSETPSYSFISGQQIKNLGDDPTRYLELANPLSQEKPFLRRSLLPNLLEALAKNQNSSSTLKLMETGKVFHSEEAGAKAGDRDDSLLPRQDTHLTTLIMDKNNDTPFLEAQRVREHVDHYLHQTSTVTAPTTPSPWQHPTRSGVIQFGTTVVGAIYELHPEIAKSYKLAYRVGVVELNLNLLTKLKPVDHKAQTVNLFPEVERDIAILTTEATSYAALHEALSAAHPQIIRVALKDTYRGDKIPAGHKSLTLALTLQHPEKTLTKEEIDEILKHVAVILKKIFKAELR